MLGKLKFLLILIDKGDVARKVANLHYKDRERSSWKNRSSFLGGRRSKFAPLIVRPAQFFHRDTRNYSFSLHYSRISVFRVNGERNRGGIESKATVQTVRFDSKGEKKEERKRRKNPIKSSINRIDDPRRNYTPTLTRV